MWLVMKLVKHANTRIGSIFILASKPLLTEFSTPHDKNDKKTYMLRLMLKTIERHV